MKKVAAKKITVIILAMALAIIMGLYLLLQLDWKKVLAEVNYSTPYTSLSDSELDEKSFRTTKSEELPQITVFMHGLGGNASHWSNNGQGKFIYDSASMPEQLRQSFKDEAKIYVVKPSYTLMNEISSRQSKEDALSIPVSKNVGNDNMEATDLRAIYQDYQPDNSADKKISLYECEENRYPTNMDPQSENGMGINELSTDDVNEHLILIFEQWTQHQSEGNDFVYSQFEYCMDAIAYQYAQLTGELPTFNLIAHSRGGITCMQYALAHPYNVASLFTMGSPFNGSNLGSFVNNNGEHILLNMVYKQTYTYPNNENDYAPGVLDILDEELYNSYKNYWNDHYSLYSHIKFRPVGSYMTAGFVIGAVREFVATKGVSGGSKYDLLWSAVLPLIGNYLLGKAQVLEWAQDCLDFITDNATRVALRVSIDVLMEEVSLFRFSGKHIGRDGTDLTVIGDDLFIHLKSQIAEGYQGANYVLKRFEYGDNMAEDNYDSPIPINFNVKKSEANIGIAHNLETYNQDIINYIISEVEKGEGYGAFNARYTSEGCYITGLKSENAQGTVEIPETYNGVDVVGIDALTMNMDPSEDVSVLSGVTEVKIPSSVKYIGDYAFFGMKNLSKVTFTGEKNIISIGDYAFGNCSSLETFDLGKVKFLMQNVFTGCSSLTNFSVDNENEFFAMQDGDGIIYSKDGTILQLYPAGKTASIFIVPERVTVIGATAFSGNTTLQSIDLKNVEIVNQAAFMDCTNLSSINAPKLKNVKYNAFENTHWLNNNTDEFVSLGDVLIKYQGNAKELHISGYTCIGPLAFANNTELEQIYFEDNELIFVRELAFTGCNNLEKIVIRKGGSTVSAVGLVLDLNSTCDIYVPSRLIDKYKTETDWGVYNDQLQDLIITIRFADGEELLDQVKEVKDGEILDNMPVLQKNGYTFIGWFTNQTADGQMYADGVMNTYTSDFTLYANWEIISYSIIYEMDGGINNVDNPVYYTVNDTITLKAPSKTGYTFVGWELNGEMLTDNQISNKTGTLTLKAVWEAKTVSVGFDSKGSTTYPATQVGRTSVFFGQTDYIFDIPVREGFKFLGWYYNGIAYTDMNGAAVREWDLESNTILYANWEAEAFKIRYDDETKSIYFSGTDWTDEEVEVTVGMRLENDKILEQTFQQYYKIEHKIVDYFYYVTPGGATKTFQLDSTFMPFIESVNGVVEFEAAFIDEEHTIFFKSNIQGHTIQSLTAKSGSSIQTELANRIPTLKGYEFGGWRVIAATYNEEVLLNTFIGTTMPDCSEAQMNSSIMVEAVWNAKTINIELDVNGGSGPANTAVLFGSESFLLPVPTRIGYTFQGWFSASGIQYTSANGQNVRTLEEEELVLIAHWTPTVYTITYVLNGGINSGNNPTQVNITQSYNLSNPTRSGYRFVGWYTDSNFTKNISRIDSCTSNLTLYAKWDKLYYLTIQHDGKNETYEGVHGQKITLPTFAKVGYDGYLYNQAEGSKYAFGSDFYFDNKNLTLVVMWESNDLYGEYTVRSNQVTITDNGRWTNTIDTVDLTKFTGGLKMHTLRNLGYKTLKLTVELDIAERKDGYQYLMIYDSATESAAIQIDGVDIEHSPGKENNNFAHYTYSFTIDINKIKSDYIYLLYGASGFGNDDWYNKNVVVSGRFTQLS